MHIPRYWAKAEQTVRRGQSPTTLERHLIVWRGSDLSLEDAHQQARQELAARIVRFQRGEPLGHYPHNIRPLREPVIQTLTNQQGERIAVVTRNAAGCLVLNTAQVMFIDLDFATALRPDWRRSLADFWGRITGRRTTQPDVEQRLLARVQDWHAREARAWQVRVYRTRAGLRLLVGHQRFDPTAATTGKLMNHLQSDQRYIRLCAIQACFRARLTPKPHRIGLHRPPDRYPWTTTDEINRQHQWEAVYAARSQGFAVCRWLCDLGPPTLHPDAWDIQRFHDTQTLATSGKPLA